MPLHIVNGIVMAEDVGSWGPAIPLTIVGGVISISSPGYYELDGAGASNDLNTINGGSNGDIAVFKIANDARNVVFKHGTDNLDLIDLDVTLDVTEERVQLQKTAAGTWVPFESRP